MRTTVHDRRTFLATMGGSGAALIATPAVAAPPLAKPKPEEEEKDLSPTEDLMREHGVLRRVLLVYQEAAGRLGGEAPVAVQVIGGAAALVRRFVEGYHEKLEETFVLPALEKKGKLIELAKVIRTQHVAGRKLTDAILETAKPGRSSNADQRRALVGFIQSFARMYAAHAAWEDTELFPAYRGLFTEAELDKLGEKFEAEEHKLLGAGGFEASLREVGDLEKALGLHDLARFTPA